MELRSLHAPKQQSVQSQLNHRIKVKKQLNSKCFLNVIKRAQCFNRKNIPACGYVENRGNFNSFMKLLNYVDPVDHELPHEHTS